MKKKIKVWFKRYFPAEAAGTLCAIIFPTAISLFSKNILVIALVGTWGENAGFYGTMMVREISQTRKKYKESNKKYGYLALAKDARNILLEFGVAETADSFFIRPAAMYFTVTAFNNMQLGILTGKIIADLIFYIPTVISYELRKKHFKE